MATTARQSGPQAETCAFALLFAAAATQHSRWPYRTRRTPRARAFAFAFFNDFFAFFFAGVRLKVLDDDGATAAGRRTVR